MARILIIDNNIDPPHGCADIVRSVNSVLPTDAGIRIEVCRGPEQAYSQNTNDLLGTIISGSKTSALANAPWIDAQMNFVKKLRTEKIPSLGLCYGQQLMAKTFGGNEYLQLSPTCEFGFVKIQKTDVGKKSAIFKDLPESFFSFCYHYDEVVKLPQGFERTAFSDRCSIHALEAEDAPMWGVQFHPERNLPESKASMSHIKKVDPKVPLLQENDAENLFNPQVAACIFKNFIAISLDRKK